MLEQMFDSVKGGQRRQRPAPNETVTRRGALHTGVDTSRVAQRAPATRKPPLNWVPSAPGGVCSGGQDWKVTAVSPSPSR
jgi:hypothetical protein